MKAVVLLNGEPFAGAIDTQDAYVYCCDGAYLWAQRQNIRTDELLGDFDSLGFVPENALRFPAEKDMTDGELALRRAVDAGATEIGIYGGGGGREDHFLGNLHLLYLAFQAGVRATMYTNRAELFVATGRVDLGGNEGKTLSLVPFFGEAHILESGGLKYPLKDLHLVLGSTRGISNVATGNEAYIVSKGAVLVIINREKEGA